MRQEKEQIVHKILDNKGFEFSDTDYDLLEKLDGGDEPTNKDQHSHILSEDQ